MCHVPRAAVTWLTQFTRLAGVTQLTSIPGDRFTAAGGNLIKLFLVLLFFSFSFRGFVLSTPRLHRFLKQSPETQSIQMSRDAATDAKRD